jgi:hypothetical protein
VIGSQSSPAEDFPVGKRHATVQRTTMLQTNRWVRFMAEVFSNFPLRTRGMGLPFDPRIPSRNWKTPFPGGEVNVKLPHECAPVNGTVVQVHCGAGLACAAHRCFFARTVGLVCSDFCFLSVMPSECGLLGWARGATLPDLQRRMTSANRFNNEGTENGEQRGHGDTAQRILWRWRMQIEERFLPRKSRPRPMEICGAHRPR